MAAVNIPRVELLDTFNIWRTRFNESLDVLQALTDIVDTTSAESGLNACGQCALGRAHDGRGNHGAVSTAERKTCRVGETLGDLSGSRLLSRLCIRVFFRQK